MCKEILLGNLVTIYIDRNLPPIAVYHHLCLCIYLSSHWKPDSYLPNLWAGPQIPLFSDDYSLHVLHCCSAPGLKCMSYYWPMFENFAKWNIPWAASRLRCLQNVNEPNSNRWHCSCLSVFPTLWIHQNNYFVPIKIKPWFDCSQRSFWIRKMEAWNSILLENPTMACKRPVSDFSWESWKGRDFFVRSNWLFESLLPLAAWLDELHWMVLKGRTSDNNAKFPWIKPKVKEKGSNLLTNACDGFEFGTPGICRMGFH